MFAAIPTGYRGIYLGMTTVTRAMKTDGSVVGTPVSRFVDALLPQQYWRAIVVLLTGQIPPVTRFP